MAGWKDMATAPDDRPILTDDGLVIRDHDLGRWVHCTREGFSFSCADNGVYDAEPSVWMEVDKAFRDGTEWAKQGSDKEQG